MSVKKFVLLGLMVTSLNACEPDSKSLQEYDHATNSIIWENVPADMNPSLAQSDLDLRDVQRILMNIVGAKDKIKIIYSETIPADVGMIKIYSIHKDIETLPTLRRGRIDNTMEFSDAANSCDLKAEDGHITHLKGFCYASIEIILPKQLPLEVYSGSKILTSHFFTVSLSELMTRLLACHDDALRLEQVQDFALSYHQTNQRARLRTSELAAILRLFKTGATRLEALRSLQEFVVDRNQLGKMIEKEFEYFDRSEARKIVGLGF